MEQVILEMEKSVPENGEVHPKVGALIVDESGRIIAKAHRGEVGKGDHAEFLAIEKAKNVKGFDFKGATLFATLEPCTHRGHGKTPCAARIVGSGFGAVYIGALDPNPRITGHGEIYLREKMDFVERFPSELERQIRTSNKEFWKLYSSGHLPSTSIYISTRVSELILLELKRAGVDIDYLPSEHEYSMRDLAAYVNGKGNFGNDRKKLMEFLMNARAEAFDQKYSDYSYDNDARRIEDKWKKEIIGILKNLRVYDSVKRCILNVGIGNGLEGVGLFEDAKAFTGVDVAPDSLRRAQARFPLGTFNQDSAEHLSTVETASQEIYLSLRVYQSAFFDIQESIRQAYRVLKPGGVCIISIANAYLEGTTFIKGLLPHGARFVDQDRAHELISIIRHYLIKLKFDDVGVHSGKAEEYVYARKRY